MEGLELEIIQKSTMLELAKEVFQIESDSILKLKDRINNNLEEAISIIIASKGRVIVTGMGKSGLIGRKIAATLSSTGTPSYFLHPAESTHGDSGIITREDVVIAISNSGETTELLNLLPLIKRFEVPLIVFAGNKNSTLGRCSDVYFDTSVEKEACPLGKAPTASTTATLAMGDALAVCLLKKRGFSTEDFLLYHPSGTLGKGVLYIVKDLMLKDKSLLPIAHEDDTFLETVDLISKKRLGCALIVNSDNKLTGLITDGDIRRVLLRYPDVSILSNKMVMTRNPKVISGADMASKALALMEKYSITSLAVCDENNSPIGILHIHDLLRAGVA
ncbi:MAG: KpsF/GutQ family sugar-phosphate isomerase [Candidatus Gastranaerophilales bacterium]|nr:KpsF/GutQ family sugar-phosphate isomerase [Candidatus Gastranaerophilales bacterium]